MGQISGTSGRARTHANTKGCNGLWCLAPLVGIRIALNTVADGQSVMAFSSFPHNRGKWNMLKRRQGFTLIELLIVIVIIGILAAIAIPKFGKTREKAYFKAMTSDLRNLMSQQEMFYSNPTNNYTYAAAVASLPDFAPSQGVTVNIVAPGQTGWGATANHSALTAAQQCGVFQGTVSALPGPALTPGVVMCTGE
jgi:type IV pilus assembly protein PilA